MPKYCYNCGVQIEDEKYCPNCGTDANPPEDVYFVEEDCGDCDAKLPRWSEYCPNCGKKFGFIPPTDPKYVAKRNKGLVAGAIFFSLVFIVISFVIFFSEGTIDLKYTLMPALVLSAIIWIITVIRWERGKFKDGTVTRHYSEERMTSRRDINNTTMTGRAKRINELYTLYSTDVIFDDGKTERFDLQCEANHIQLQIGDRIRYYLSTRTYRKI